MVNLIIADVRKDIATIIADALIPTIPISRIFVQNQQGSHGDYTEGPWAKITIKHQDGMLTSIGGEGFRRIEVSGIVTVQLFVEVESKDKLTVMDPIADIVVNALEVQQTSSEIEFRNVIAREVGTDEVWFQTNVLADFNYEKIK